MQQSAVPACHRRLKCKVSGHDAEVQQFGQSCLQPTPVGPEALCCHMEVPWIVGMGSSQAEVLWGRCGLHAATWQLCGGLGPGYAHLRCPNNTTNSALHAAHPGHLPLASWFDGDAEQGPSVVPTHDLTLKAAQIVVLPGGLVAHRPQVGPSAEAGPWVHAAKPAGEWDKFQSDTTCLN